jgi:hypothetical protein
VFVEYYTQGLEGSRRNLSIRLVLKSLVDSPFGSR